jgi:hypothetical protein
MNANVTRVCCLSVRDHRRISQHHRVTAISRYSPYSATVTPMPNPADSFGQLSNSLEGLAHTIGDRVRRERMFERCMEARGYTKENAPKIAVSHPTNQRGVDSRPRVSCAGTSVWNGTGCTTAPEDAPTSDSSTPTTTAAARDRSMPTSPSHVPVPGPSGLEQPRPASGTVAAITPAWLAATWNGMYRGREVAIRIVDDSASTMSWAMIARTPGGISVGQPGSVRIGVANNTRVLLTGYDLSGTVVQWRLSRDADVLRGEVLTVETSETVLLRRGR